MGDNGDSKEVFRASDLGARTRTRRVCRGSRESCTSPPRALRRTPSSSIRGPGVGGSSTSRRKDRSPSLARTERPNPSATNFHAILPSHPTRKLSGLCRWRADESPCSWGCAGRTGKCGDGDESTTKLAECAEGHQPRIEQGLEQTIESGFLTTKNTKHTKGEGLRWMAGSDCPAFLCVLLGCRG